MCYTLQLKLQQVDIIGWRYPWLSRWSFDRGMSVSSYNTSRNQNVTVYFKQLRKLHGPNLNIKEGKRKIGQERLNAS